MHIYLVFGVFDGIKGSMYDVMGVQNHDKLEQNKLDQSFCGGYPVRQLQAKSQGMETFEVQ